MKNHILLVVSLFTVLSCNTVNIEIENTGIVADTSFDEGCAIEVSSVDAVFPSFKSVLDASGRVMHWEEGDRISVCTASVSRQFTLQSGAGTNTGIFTGHSIPVTTGTTLYAIYPECNLVGTTASIKIETNQTSISRYDLGGNDIYVASADVMQSPVSSIAFSFRPLGTVINLHADLSEYPSDKIQSVRMECPGQAITGNFSLDLSNPDKGLSAKTSVDYVEVGFPDVPSAADPLNVSFAIAPCGTISSICFIITTDKRVLKFSRSGSLDGGGSYTVDFKSADDNDSECGIPLISPISTEYVSRVTGDSENDNLPNPTNTYTNFALPATDYGIMWEAGNGNILSAFGDNWTDKAFKQNWKSNTLGITSNSDLENGIKFSAFVMDGNARKEIIPHTAGDNTFSYIPSAGIAVGRRQYMLFSKHIMKPEPATPDSYLSEYSELAYSDDYGQNWVRSGVQWSGTGNFVQGSFVKINGFVYFYGIPSGRLGVVKVARVLEDRMLEKSAWRYWDGNKWNANENAAIAITQGPAGELSVFYNSFYNRYIMMYLSVSNRAIVFRQSDNPEGDWSGEQILQEDTGEGLYGPSVHPYGKDGKDIYYVVSHAMNFAKTAQMWNVYLMKTSLDVSPERFNLVSEGGFEDYPTHDLPYRSFWYFPEPSHAGNVYMDRTTVHSGKVAVRIDNPKDNWVCIFQTVAVKPNTDYEMTCWAKTRFSDSRALFLCAKTADNVGELACVNPLLTDYEWRKVSLKFNSGNNGAINVFINTAGWTTDKGENLYIYVDDVCLSRL